MNRENVQTAINIMKRAGLVKMKGYQVVQSTREPSYWRCAWGTSIATTEEELRSCGNAACFAGWVAVSPEWADWGGHRLEGAPCTTEDGEDLGHYAIAKWLDIPEPLAKAFVHGDRDSGGMGAFSFFYDKDWSEVGAADVIAKLELVLAVVEK